jgi:hypothetical protein
MKWYYRLMTKGYIEKRYKKEEVRWNVPHYSKVKYVYANDEDTARAMIRSKLKNKWTGFRLIKQ